MDTDKKGLILARKAGETVHIKCPDGAEIVLTTLDSNGANSSRIAFKAPKEYKIFRGEERNKDTYGNR